MDECLNDDVDVVGRLDIVQPAKPRVVLGKPRKAACGLGERAQLGDVFLSERRGEQVLCKGENE